MELIGRILKVILLTFMVSLLFYTANYFISKPPEPNMYGVGLIFSSVIYSVLNTILVFVIYITTYIINRKIYKRILSMKFLLLEIILLYVCIAIIYCIPYSFNVLPINRVTEHDSFCLFTPLIFLYVLWLIIISIINFRHKED